MITDARPNAQIVAPRGDGRPRQHLMTAEQRHRQREAALQRARRESYTRNPATLRWRERMIAEMVALGVTGLSPYRWSELKAAARARRTATADNQSAI